MTNWLNVFKHLLPNGQAWSLTVDKRLREFFQGLTGIGADARAFLDAIFSDIDPQKTRDLQAWERQFGLRSTGMSEQSRRDRLAAAWRAIGQQDPRYIEDALRTAGFDVYVHEWWEPTAEYMGCGEPLAECGEPTAQAGNTRSVEGSVNGDVVPVARNPFTYLWDGSSPREFVGSGHDLAYCGGDVAFSNSQIDPAGYPLVNKVLESNTAAVGAGHVELFCGGLIASSGSTVTTYNQKQYVMPADPTKYPYFLYIGGQNFPDTATIPASRRDEFEDLCLKICPTEQWLGIMVSYT